MAINDNEESDDADAINEESDDDVQQRQPQSHFWNESKRLRNKRKSTNTYHHHTYPTTEEWVKNYVYTTQKFNIVYVHCQPRISAEILYCDL